MSLRRLVANTVCLLILALCTLNYFRTNIARTIPTLSTPSDFSSYYQAAQGILHGLSPYNDPAIFYPPLLPFLMAPLGLVDYVTARWIWFLLSHLFLLAAAGLLWRSLGGGRVALCCIAGVWAYSGPCFESLRLGQLAPLLVLLLTIAYAQRGDAAGVAAGLSAALKYFPGIVIVPLLPARRWRELTVAAAVALACLSLPWLAVRLFFSGASAPVSATYWMGTPSMWSWSIPSVVLRALIPITKGAPLPADWEFGNVAANLHLEPRLRWISVATACSVFALGMAALAAVCRGRLNTRQIPFAMAGLVSLSLAIAPVCWTHYQLLQYPGIAMMLIVAIRRRYWLLALATATSFALAYQLPQDYLIAYQSAHNGFTTASPATLYLWTSVPAFASLAIFALSLIMVRADPEN